MKSYSLFFFLLLAGLKVFAGAPIGLKSYSSKVSSKDTTWNKMHYLDQYPNPVVTIQLGGMWLNSNARLRINSERLGVGTSIDLDRDLGINPKAFAGLGQVYFRIGKRHQIVLSGFAYERSKTKTLERDINFADTTFYTRASVKGKTHFIAYNLDYRFSIYKDPRGEIGLSVGAKLYDVFASIEANVNQSTVRSYSQRKRVYAPALLPGIHGSYYITHCLLFRGKAEYLQLTVSDWKFKVLEITPALEFYPIPNLGVGASYNYFNGSISKIPGDDLNGNVRYIINGVSLFGSLRF